MISTGVCENDRYTCEVSRIGGCWETNRFIVFCSILLEIINIKGTNASRFLSNEGTGFDKLLSRWPDGITSLGGRGLLGYGAPGRRRQEADPKSSLLAPTSAPAHGHAHAECHSCAMTRPSKPTRTPLRNQPAQETAENSGLESSLADPTAPQRQVFLRVWPSSAPLPAGDGSQHPSPLSSLLKSKKKDVPRGTRGDPGLGSSESSAGARSLGPTARWARADGERPSGRPRPSRPHRGSSRILVAPGPRLVGSGRAREQAAAVRPRSSRPRPRRFALPPPRSGDAGRVRHYPGPRERPRNVSLCRSRRRHGRAVSPVGP